MHVALGTDDILCEIFGHVQRYALEDPQTPYHAALVCKRFLPHALDALWFSMNTLEPLKALIPETSKMMSLDNNALALTGFPHMEDLSAFDLYARRIIDLALPATYGICVPVMMVLLECLDRRHLLPNLRVLSIDGHRGLNEADSFFFSSKLERLQVRVQYQRDLCFLLPRLAQTAPSLRHLTLFDHTIPDAMMHLTSHFKKLHSLETKNEFIISSDSSEPLPSSFPFAEHLTTWHVGSIVFRQGNTETPSIIQFPSLTTLVLANPTAAKEITRLLSYSIFPKLRAITFAPLYNDNPVAYKKSLLNLCSELLTSLPNGLRLLYIRENASLRAVSREAIQMDLEDLFSKAQKNQTLRRLWISEHKLLNRPTLASMDRLCAAFPFLTDLYLNLHATALVSFDFVAVLAAKLPLLNYLDIGIDGSTLADPPSVPLLSHSLKELCLRNSEIGDTPFLFARYLDHLFPFTTIDEDVLPDEGETVVSALKLVRDCRRDQEKRSAPAPLRRSKRLEISDLK